MTFDEVAFLQKLIAIPSCDPPGGELDVARIVHQTMLDGGLESELDEFLPGRANVIGRLRGLGIRKPLVLSAHLDTLPVGDQPWSFDPFSGEIVDGRVRGRGSTDMKSAISTFIAAVLRLKKRNTPLAGDVILAFTAGESTNCLGARRLVEQGFKNEIGAFLCGEPSTMDIVIVEKAILWLRATAKGTLGHVSGAAGTNAIQLMSSFLTHLGPEALDLPDHPLLTPASVNVGRIWGGSAINLTPDLCETDIDVRFGPGIHVDAVLDHLRALAPEGISLQVTDYKPSIEEKPDSPFVSICATAVKQRLGRAPALKGVSYYSDGAILLEGLDHVPFAILGPGDLGGSGQYDESVSVENIRAIVDIYAAIAEAWLCH